jgi:hypothetical protein
MDSVQCLEKFLASFPPEYQEKYLKKVPLPRLVNPLSWKTRLLISVRKFPLGFIGGFIITFLKTLQASGPDAWSTVGLLTAVAGGVTGGLGLTGVKVYKETAKDNSLKPARAAMDAVVTTQARTTLTIVETVMSVALTLSRLYGLRVDEALREVAIVLGTTAELPRQAHELLQVVARVLSEDSEGGAVITADEAIEIIQEAKDVKDAAGALLLRLKQ